jgi:AraC-like DNA-binding protein
VGPFEKLPRVGRKRGGMTDVPVSAGAGTSRSTSATIQPNILRYLVLVAEERGVDLRPALEQVGLDAVVMSSADLRVSYRQGSAVIRRALELTGDEHLGMSVGAAQHLTAWGLLGFAVMASDTLADAIETGVRYQNLSGAMVVWSCGRENGAFVLRAQLPDPSLDPAAGVFLLEEALTSVITVGRLAVGPSLAPRLVELALPRPVDANPYPGFFGCPVRFDAPVSQLVLDERWARLRMPARDPVALASSLELLDALMASRRDQQELLEVLEVSVAQRLPDVPSFVEQALRLALSERTLRRRLTECGTTYQALVEGVRRERVEQLLGRPELTAREIARRAGFSDERALRRAVRRWHGSSPQELRRAMSAARSLPTTSAGR